MITGKKSITQTLNALFWLLGTLYVYPKGLTLKELTELWQANKSLSSGEILSRQTLYKYKQAIQELFRVEIKCDRSNNKYQISNNHDDSLVVANNEVFLSIVIRNLLVSDVELCECINFNNFNRDKQYLYTLLYAIKNQITVKLSYRDFDGRHKTHLFCPTFLEFNKRTWYVQGSQYGRFRNPSISIALSSITKLEECKL